MKACEVFTMTELVLPWVFPYSICRNVDIYHCATLVPEKRSYAMAKYLFVYHGGGGAPSSPDEVKRIMDAWGEWFGSMGSAVIDGGNPVGKSSTVKSDGSLVSGGGANPVSGYSLIEAASLEDAHNKAKGCPLLKRGGTIEIAQAIDM
jgi:hypothetical protein